MRRREFIKLLGSATTAWPLAVHAQQPKNVPRVGFLGTGSLESPEQLASINAFQKGLHELGTWKARTSLLSIVELTATSKGFPF
jgi:putative ABC transport system substrate-binding protein